MQFQYLKNMFELQMQFLAKFNLSLIIFNGNPWFRFLIENKFSKISTTEKITNKFNIYFFEIHNEQAILFDKFFTLYFWVDRQASVSNYSRFN